MASTSDSWSFAAFSDGATNALRGLFSNSTSRPDEALGADGAPTAPVTLDGCRRLAAQATQGPSSAKEGSAGTSQTEEQVDKDMNNFLANDPHVIFMLEEMEKIGCKCDYTFFNVKECDGETVGGFVPGMGVVLCHNIIQDSSETRNTMLHELVHAYDHCRAEDLDWTNCLHHACSEVRAANLSGDCTAAMERKRGRHPYWPGFQKSCVRRRAELSVSMNAHCKNTAASAVASVMEDCYADTAPYSRPP